MHRHDDSRLFDSERTTRVLIRVVL